MLRIAASLSIAVCMAAPAGAQPVAPWLVRVEAGSATIHRFVAEPSGPLAGVRLARGWQDDRVRFDVGLTKSAADRGFVLIDGAFEVRLCRSTCRVTPFAHVAAGPLIEPGYGHSRSFRAGGGVEVMLRRDDLVRFTIARGVHGRDARGPHLISVGYSRRFGG